MINIENCRVVITGAARDMGRTLGICFAQLGAEVFLSARDVKAVARLRDELVERGYLVIFRFRDRAKVADQHERLHLGLEKRDADSACRALTDYMLDLRKQYAQAQEARAKANKQKQTRSARRS